MSLAKVCPGGDDDFKAGLWPWTEILGAHKCGGELCARACLCASVCAGPELKIVKQLLP